jgi:hypothetical protein
MSSSRDNKKSFAPTSAPKAKAPVDQKISNNSAQSKKTGQNGRPFKKSGKPFKKPEQHEQPEQSDYLLEQSKKFEEFGQKYLTYMCEFQNKVQDDEDSSLILMAAGAYYLRVLYESTLAALGHFNDHPYDRYATVPLDLKELVTMPFPDGSGEKSYSMYDFHYGPRKPNAKEFCERYYGIYQKAGLFHPFKVAQHMLLHICGLFLVDESDPSLSHKSFVKIYRKLPEYVHLWHGMNKVPGVSELLARGDIKLPKGKKHVARRGKPFSLGKNEFPPLVDLGRRVPIDLDERVPIAPALSDAAADNSVRATITMGDVTVSFVVNGEELSVDIDAVDPEDCDGSSGGSDEHYDYDDDYIEGDDHCSDEGDDDHCGEGDDDYCGEDADDDCVEDDRLRARCEELGISMEQLLELEECERRNSRFHEFCEESGISATDPEAVHLYNQHRGCDHEYHSDAEDAEDASMPSLVSVPSHGNTEDAKDHTAFLEFCQYNGMYPEAPESRHWYNQHRGHLNGFCPDAVDEVPPYRCYPTKCCPASSCDDYVQPVTTGHAPMYTSSDGPPPGLTRQASACDTLLPSPSPLAGQSSVVQSEKSELDLHGDDIIGKVMDSLGLDNDDDDDFGDAEIIER